MHMPTTIRSTGLTRAVQIRASWARRAGTPKGAWVQGQVTPCLTAVQASQYTGGAANPMCAVNGAPQGVVSSSDPKKAVTPASIKAVGYSILSCPSSMPDGFQLNITYQVMTSMGTARCAAYDIAGVARQASDATGNTVTTATGESTNYSLPSLITPNSQSNLATNVTYNGAFAVTSVTGANGATVNTTYDIYGRPATSTSSDGVTTTYTYSYNPNTQTATLDADAQGRHQWKKTTLDGFGRAIEVDSGYDTTTVTIVETQYAPCACSPIGKMWRTSLPHAPGGNVQWTTYVYDARGRTIEMWKPDGSITHYSYAGNVTTVTDPAGKWKKFTYDAQNNLVMVTEPDPANGNNTLTTNYSYNAANQ